MKDSAVREGSPRRTQRHGAASHFVVSLSAAKDLCIRPEFSVVLLLGVPLLLSGNTKVLGREPLRVAKRLRFLGMTNY
jgi:hypothetical protein